MRKKIKGTKGREEKGKGKEEKQKIVSRGLKEAPKYVDAKKVKRFKTPKKKTRKFSELLSDESGGYKRQKAIDVLDAEDMSDSEKISAILLFIKNMDVGIKGLQTLLMTLKNDFLEANNEIHASQLMLERKIALATRDMGSKSSRLASIIESPHI